ncbi:MAG TPA: hypothetical protein VME17_07560 [Bryobacteraceae bacterium]|nr:hypothetical protein [Bryobacteraceae bacterium]
MVNSITSSSQVAQTYQLQQHQTNPQTQKNVQGDQEPQDTVVLSKQATGTNDLAQGDPDHDGH